MSPSSLLPSVSPLQPSSPPLSAALSLFVSLDAGVRPRRLVLVRSARHDGSLPLCVFFFPLLFPPFLSPSRSRAAKCMLVGQLLHNRTLRVPSHVFCFSLLALPTSSLPPFPILPSVSAADRPASSPPVASGTAGRGRGRG